MNWYGIRPNPHRRFARYVGIHLDPMVNCVVLDGQLDGGASLLATVYWSWPRWRG
jgi:hypothetical protein